ncbi:polysaccharide pyruvyl transferase family protein [Pseudoalteromonas xiamenensis]|uniref:polysaccharide pyruvyl transferase family protein n=1 Tax=Pseudoalteromonas xiamenensis TaxID=882626 RepID=UPI0027E5102B|nr:polysaccharide pyruvyl transferase family protein [Pseudoalteromonas xiamenensis]WMN61218.1 polysaccharide pyruvyl transferase family protein [Pseudoalteromonas xiamenensis]
MINIEIKGVQFSNKGAELMLLSILAQLEKELGEYNLVLSPGPNLPYKMRAKLGAFQKLSFRRGPLDLTGIFGKLPHFIKRLLKRYGIVTEADVDVILNASGFSYGDQWPLNDLKNAAKEAVRFKKAGKPYILLPQALGPFTKVDHAKAAHLMINSSTKVYARDRISFQACKVLNENGCLELSPDFTALIEPKIIEPFDNKTVCFIPNNKVVSKYHNEEAQGDIDKYVAFWRNQAEIFIKYGFDVILLNHEGEEDKLLCNKIAEAIEGDIQIVDTLEAIEIKAFLGGCHAVVSSRFHGCVSALSQGIPCLATSWSHKYEMLFEEYGLIDNVIDFKCEKDVVEDKLINFINTLKEQSVVCLQVSNEVKEKNIRMWKSVISLIKTPLIDTKISH